MLLALPIWVTVRSWLAATVMRFLSVAMSVSIFLRVRMAFNSSAVMKICGMERKRRVSSIVLMNRSRSAGEGPFKITYSSPSRPLHSTITNTMMKPASLSQKRRALRWRISFFFFLSDS